MTSGRVVWRHTLYIYRGQPRKRHPIISVLLRQWTYGRDCHRSLSRSLFNVLQTQQHPKKCLRVSLARTSTRKVKQGSTDRSTWSCTPRTHTSPWWVKPIRQTSWFFSRPPSIISVTIKLISIDIKLLAYVKYYWISGDYFYGFGVMFLWKMSTNKHVTDITITCWRRVYSFRIYSDFRLSTSIGTMWLCQDFISSSSTRLTRNVSMPRSWWNTRTREEAVLCCKTSRYLHCTCNAHFSLIKASF